MHYLQLGPVGGRGGTQRFFMLANGIPFEEKLFAVPGEWGNEKKRLIETGENPCGGVPVTYVDNVHMAQHVSTCRYLARTNKLDTGDNLKDYYQDMIADEYQGFRNLWVVKTFEASDVEKAEYKTKTLPTLLAKFDALYKKYKTADPYLSTSPDGKPLWGDTAMFSIIYDNIQTGHMTEDILKDYPNLQALYKAFGAIPAVAGWIEKVKSN